MAFSPIQREPKKKGGGFLGKVIGTTVGGAIGAVAAPFTGGTSILGGMAAGSALGGTLGGVADAALDPAKVTQPKGPTPLENAARFKPEVAIAQLNEAQSLLESDTEMPDDELTMYRNHFDEARKRLMTRRIG